MHLEQLLYSQGFGTRRICAGLIAQGRVQLAGRVESDPGFDVAIDNREGAAPVHFSVQGVEWTFHEHAYLMLHKPAGTECSRKPSTWPSVYTLLPAPLRQRPNKGAAAGVQAVGRLDQDTTGLLLFTDDGRFVHRLSSPRHHVPKVYQAGLKHPVDKQQVERLLAGVTLDDSPDCVRAAACTVTGSHTMELTLTEGKYHQVKRMVAAVSNRVETLHRSSIGAVALPADLAPGRWRWLRADEVRSLRA
ncbi:MAG: 16S rRNA pseudouridine(516) synthase [Variovorax sp.]